MKLPIEWLKEFVAVKLSPRQLAERLTMAGLEIGAIEEMEAGAVFDIEITPNRPDWLSIAGIAREVAAITQTPLKVKSPASGGGTQRMLPGAGALRIDIEDRQACPWYVGRLIEAVSVGPSPDWMQKRLQACGARPVNNIVDVTNYVLFECGQPLHAFDADLLVDTAIRIRRAQAGEALTTLDGISRKLTADVLVIADAKRPVAIAGIMGGSGSGVTGQTKRIVLESALFDPITIRRTARKLGLSSESSYRFERGVDPEGVGFASARAAALIRQLAGGTETAIKSAGMVSRRRVSIAVEPIKVQQWLGVPVKAASLKKTFSSLGCRVIARAGKPSISVTPPPYRRDLVRDVDLYEEVARLIGYDRIKASVPCAAIAPAGNKRQEGFFSTQQLRRACAGLGLQEVITWSLISQPELARCGWTARDSVPLVNPLSQDHALLRPSLLPGMLQVIRRNLSQGALGVRIFEVGYVTVAGVPAAQAEQLVIGIALSGIWLRDWKAADACDFFRLKGLVEALAAPACRKDLEFAAEPAAWAQQEESTAIAIKGQAVGRAGLVARAVTQALDIEQDVWFAELSAQALIPAQGLLKQAAAPSSFPPVKRDLSVLLNREVGFKAVAQAIAETVGDWAARVELIDRYTGKQVPESKYSATFSIEYRNAARTLTAAEVDDVHKRVTQTLIERFGAVRR